MNARPGVMGLSTLLSKTMVAYNFKKQFAELVSSGSKQQTIRAVGDRRHAEPGDAVQLYTGQRTKECRKLVKPDPVCYAKHLVHISTSGNVTIGSNHLDDTALELFAFADGFKSAEEFINFFRDTHGLPFTGVLIKWK